jgi:YesN/AraC family two-component response regulator
MIKVLIADDHDIVREGVKQIVSETSEETLSFHRYDDGAHCHTAAWRSLYNAV